MTRSPFWYEEKILIFSTDWIYYVYDLDKDVESWKHLTENK